MHAARAASVRSLTPAEIRLPKRSAQRPEGRWSPSASSRPVRRGTTSTRSRAHPSRGAARRLGRRGLLRRRHRGRRRVARTRRRRRSGSTATVDGEQLQRVLAGQASAHGRGAPPQRLRRRLRRDVLRAQERRASCSASATRAIADGDPRGARARRRAMRSPTSRTRSPSRAAVPAAIAGSTRRRAYGRGVPASDQPRRRPAAAHARRRRQPDPGRPTGGGRRSTGGSSTRTRAPRASSTRRRSARSSRERLGVRWRPVRNGMAEIDGVPEKVLRAFSRRRAEIEEAMARHGSAGREAAQMAALATRRAKDRERPTRAARARMARPCGPSWTSTQWRIERHLPARPDGRAARLGRAVRRARRPGRAHARPVDVRPPRRASRRSAQPPRDGATVAEPSALPPTPSSAARTPSGCSARRAGRRAAVLDARAARDREPRSSMQRERLAASGRGAVAPDAVDAAIDRRPFLADEQRTHGAPAHPGRRRRRGRHRPRGNRQDHRARRRARGVGAVRRPRPRLRARAAGRPRARAQGRAARHERRRACCAARARSPPGTVLDRRRGRDARHPRPREAARPRRGRATASSSSPATRASCRRSRPAARSGR